MLKLRELREEQGISLDKLGEIFHVQKSSLSRIETGKQEPKADLINALADYFNVTTDYLLGRTEERHAKKERFQGVTTISAHRIGNIEQLPDEALDQLDDYIEYLKIKYEK